MSEKIITEFSLRLNKARNQLTEVNNHCSTLKKEAAHLKKVRPPAYPPPADRALTPPSQQLDESTHKRDEALKS